MAYKHEHGYDGLTVGQSGFLICESHPFLGATPDGTVYDPSNPQQPFGFVEVKCPYSQRDHTPAEARSSPGFCCNLNTHVDGSQTLQLKENHAYFAQVQGQMAVGDRPWCDFVISQERGSVWRGCSLTRSTGRALCFQIEMLGQTPSSSALASPKS